MKHMFSHPHLVRVGGAIIATLVQMAAIAALFGFQSIGVV
jgi:hypothetical protein